jgi:hypothetical protein
MNDFFIRNFLTSQKLKIKLELSNITQNEKRLCY